MSVREIGEGMNWGLGRFYLRRVFWVGDFKESWIFLGGEGCRYLGCV